MTDSLFLSTNIVRDSLEVCMWYVIVGVAAAVLTIGQFSIWGYYGTCKSIFVLFMIIACYIIKTPTKYIGEAIGSQFRKDYFELLLKQDVGYHDIKNSGTLNTKLISESTAVAAGSGVKMGFFLQNVGTIVLGFAMALFIHGNDISIISMCTSTYISWCFTNKNVFW